MTFGITPVTGFPAPTPTENKRSIQFQWNGENIGERNTDTVDFESLSSPNLLVTIGVGELPNVLTVGSAVNAAVPGVWLDRFLGAPGDSLDGHVQDSPFNGSVWAAIEDAFFPSLFSSGFVGTNAETPGGPAGAISRFDDGGAVALAWGWTIEVLMSQQNLSEYSPITTFTLEGQTGTLAAEINLATSELTITLGGDTVVLAEIENGTEQVTWPIDVTMNEGEALVYLSGVLVHTFTSGTFRSPLYAKIEMSGESPASPRLGRVGFSGTVTG